MPKRKIEIDGVRQEIVNHQGHLLVLGGPGSGKTTVALVKAKKLAASLCPGQELLFLSFSRAAVRQVLLRSEEFLTGAERSFLTVKTYHAFCIEALQSHDRVMTGQQPRFIYPREETTLKATHKGDWHDEVARLADRGVYCFDAVAGAVARLLEQCPIVRDLYVQKFPFVVVDEFQDTDENQWRIVQALSSGSTIFCLADAEQRIFEYRKDIDPRRIEKAREALSLKVFDLGGDNHRSPNAGILSFADAVLNNRPLPSTADVGVSYYYPNAFASHVHLATVRMFYALRRLEIDSPTVAILCRSNALVSQLSTVLSEAHDVATTKGKVTLPAIEHSVVWDAELTMAAASVVASILEWPTKTESQAAAATLAALSTFYRLKHAQRPSAAAQTAIARTEKAMVAVASDKVPATKVGKALISARSTGIALFGEPSQDWLAARDVLLRTGLDDVHGEARMMRLFRARDEVGGTLADLWLRFGHYAGAQRLVEDALDRQVLMSTDREPRGCVLMSIHKSKGKEFDAVILVEGSHSSPFFDARDKPPYAASRRLLRVAITRARTRVQLVRPHSCLPLVG